MRISFLHLLLVFCFLTVPAFAAGSRVDAIEVDGAQRIAQSTVLAYLGVSEGDSVERADLDRSLKTLFATGLFADVVLRLDGSTLKVKVVENPIINRIAFEGNDKLENDELRAEIALRPRQVFTRTKAQSDVSRLYQLYRRNGRFATKIEPKVIQLDQNRVDLVFEIEEGDLTKIKAIRFIGNNHFEDQRLRAVISTKESVWYSFISNADRYDPDRLAYDQELLRQFYLGEGYADFDLQSAVAELSQDREGFFITFTVDEGDRYKVRQVDVESQISAIDGGVFLNDDARVKPGEWYSSRDVQYDISRITDELGDMQYAFVNVRPRIDRDREAKELDVTFRIDEAPRSFIEQINITGNTRTLDKVIRREMLLVEGDPFNKSKLSRSEQAIRNLDFFENISFDVRQGSAPDKTVIDIAVQEKSTGEISLGAGFSTSDGVIGDISLTERNLLGKGQSVRVGAVVSGDTSRFDVGFMEPAFLNRDVAAGINVFNKETENDESRNYDEQNTGGSVYLNYPLSDRWRQTLKYRLDRSDISNVNDSSTRFTKEQEGERTTSAISQKVTYDSRNSTLFPTEGTNFWFETELAGLGFDSKFVSAVTGVSQYFPVTDKITFNVLTEAGAMAGYGDEDVNVNERFYLGGPTSFRGFERYGVGPRDLEGNDTVGGNLFYRGTLQFDFPVGLPEKYGVKGHAFSDFGSLWDADETHPDIVNEHAFRASAGLGMTWRSPFGPIGVYYANPFMEEDYDQLKEFEFNFGTRF